MAVSSECNQRDVLLHVTNTTVKNPAGETLNQTQWFLLTVKLLQTENVENIGSALDLRVFDLFHFLMKVKRIIFMYCSSCVLSFVVLFYLVCRFINEQQV